MLQSFLKEHSFLHLKWQTLLRAQQHLILEETFKDYQPVLDNIDALTNRVFNAVKGRLIKDKTKRSGEEKIISAQEQLRILLQTKIIT